MITLGQARYLMVIYGKKGKDRTMSRIADELGVSKPSVTNMINGLKEKGLVQQSARGISLTSQGKAVTEGVLRQQSLLSAYFGQQLELEKDKVDDDALTMLFELSKPFVERLTARVEQEKAREVLRRASHGDHLTSFHGILEDGSYEAPFTILKKEDGSPSMGDQGFLHPARLVITENHAVVMLRPVSVSHRTKQGDKLRGRVSKLFFWNGTDFEESEEKDGTYTFPVADMVWKEREDDECGLVQLKVQASVGTINMPESEACMAIYL